MPPIESGKAARASGGVLPGTILGWRDKTLNKRMYYFRGSDYSYEAASIGLSLRMGF